MKSRVLAGLLLCPGLFSTGALAQPSPFAPTLPLTSPAPNLAPGTPVPPPSSNARSAAAGLLPGPRISSADGTTRVVLDLPEDARYSLTPTFGGLRIDVANVTARPSSAGNISPEVSSWQYTSTAGGAIATIFTHFPLGLDGGWRSFELPGDEFTARRLVIDFAATLRGGAQNAPEGTVRIIAPANPPPGAATSVPTLPLPDSPPPLAGLTPLTAPRIGKTPGSTRVVLELPFHSTYTITPGPQGLYVELTGVTSAPQAAQQVSPELAEWRFEPTTRGVGVNLRTAFTMNGRGGFTAMLLPPAEGATLRRLAIDIAPAMADTSPLPLTEAALPRFVMPVRIVLDPGHGGSDPGAIGTVVEKHVALDVSLRVRALLRAAGAQVIMTRERDTQLSSNKNSDLALRGGAGRAPNDVLVSIHVNAMDKNAVMRGYGVETWWYPNASGSSRLAARLQSQVIRFSGAYSQGLKSTSLAVLRNSRIPSALVEIGYTSHPVDGQNLLSPHYLDRVAAGIAWGIRDYLTPDNASLQDH